MIYHLRIYLKGTEENHLLYRTQCFAFCTVLIRIKYDNIEKSMEASGYSEKSLLASHTVLRHIPEDSLLTIFSASPTPNVTEVLQVC